jgi:hypothetical protein
MIAVVYLLVSGGWWVVLGWTLFAATIVVCLVRLVKHAPGAQHNGGVSGRGTGARAATHPSSSSATRTRPDARLTLP